MESLEWRSVRPRQARYQAALRPTFTMRIACHRTAKTALRIDAKPSMQQRKVQRQLETNRPPVFFRNVRSQRSRQCAPQLICPHS